MKLNNIDPNTPTSEIRKLSDHDLNKIVIRPHGVSVTHLLVAISEYIKRRDFSGKDLHSES